LFAKDDHPCYRMGHRRMTWGVQRGRRQPEADSLAIRPFQGWPNRNGVKWSGMAAPVETLGSLSPPLAIRPRPRKSISQNTSLQRGMRIINHSLKMLTTYHGHHLCMPLERHHVLT
jgi:hypothetical protein